MAQARKTEKNMSYMLASQIITGSQVRNARRNGTVSAMTRAQATAEIAWSDNGGIIAGFLSHGNKHVAAYAAHKLLSGMGEGLAKLSTMPVQSINLASYNLKAWTAEQAGEVLSIIAERNLTAESAAQQIGCTTRRINDWSKKLAKKG
jgi:hypothetical protein